MREIKFRAWDKKTKKMYFNVEDTYDGMSGHEDYDSFGNLVGNYEVELMQYTGFKGANDVEVYEGDIVEYSEYFSPLVYNKTLVIKWRKSGFWLWDIALEEWFSSMCSDERLKVVGNIYENPELLEVA